MKKSSWREAVMDGSSTRRDPAAALRGLAKRRQAGGFPLGVGAFRRLCGQHHLAANLPVIRGVGFEAQRDGADGPRVFSDFFADHAVAAGDGLRHVAVAIMNGQREPVHLQFGDVGELLIAQKCADAAVEIAQLVLAQRVVQTQHGARMGDLDEAFARLAADALGGRIRRDQLRMGLLPAP